MNDRYLMHYGVKGMKWGVRRAIERQNYGALNRHYSAAARKLKTLTARSDKDLVRISKKQNAKNTAVSTLASGLMSGGLTMGMNSHLPAAERLKWSAIAGGVGAGAAALSGGVNQAYLAALGSKRGNARQNAKRKAWEKEMRRAFKGTKYAKQINRTKRDIYRSIEDTKREWDPTYRSSNRSGSSHSKKRRR